MREFNTWTIEQKYIVRFPANINSLSPKQFRKVLQLYYQDYRDFAFRTLVFLSLAKLDWKTKLWFTWHMGIKKFLSYFLPIQPKVFAEGDLEHVIDQITQFLIEDPNEEQELLATQLIPTISLPVFRFLGRFSPRLRIKGHSDFYQSMTFEDYQNAEKAFLACNLREPDAFDELIKALYKSKRKIEGWQLATIPDYIKRGVYFEYNDIREYWKRSYEQVFENEGSKDNPGDDFTSDDLLQQMQTWMHYIADEKPTNYESVNQQPIYNILFAWNEIRNKQKKEKEELDKMKRKS